eukprot:11226522-Lingulodinium_polyedra.AAC.1
MLAILDAECAESGDGVFGVAFDMSKAHRRVRVRPDDWGLMACSLVSGRREPDDSDAIHLNQ